MAYLGFGGLPARLGAICGAKDKSNIVDYRNTY